MQLQTNKLYLASPHTKLNTAQNVPLELSGNVNLEIKGSFEKTLVESELTFAAAFSESGFQTLFYFPKYVAFVGTADKINVVGYDFTLIGDLI